MEKVKDIRLSYDSNDPNIRIISFTIVESNLHDVSSGDDDTVLIPSSNTEKETVHKNQIRVDDLTNILYFIEHVHKYGSSILPKDLVERIQSIGADSIAAKSSNESSNDSQEVLERYRQEMRSKLELVRDQLILIIDSYVKD